MAITLGSERALRDGVLDGARVGVVSNPASVDRQFRHVADRVAALPGVTLAALFGPQHGFHATAQDNMVETGHARHPRLGVPVYSLYSDTREPTATMLKGLDLLVIDLQDVGTRVYTYIWTMANCLRAAARAGVGVVVCDRPNPIGGEAVEGPVLDPAFASFVGQLPIPLRHGMTIGELARLFNEEFGIGADLQVVAMEGWSRAMCHDEAGAPWVIPSPNVPTLDSAIVYPGMVLLEGTMLSEGRGTTRPFELAGAPGVEPDALAARLNGLGLPGVHARPATFEPTFQKHAGAVCGGCQLHVTDRRAFRPVMTAVALIAACRDALGEAFRWREPPYEYEAQKMPIDILAGTDALRRDIERGRPLEAMAADRDAAVAAFAPIRERYLLY
ncbi:MAG: DUF1343 domain-containing protein [Acidobacteria bacterium]|nr:DUF1343 domain-containing protein [Acidobacteriota bacterium]MYJ05646.1 DUF1343 domain-containing protein [Acidobacteriota bacterium]